MEADAATLIRLRLATPGHGSLLQVLYRVYDLPEELRAKLRAKRAKMVTTTAQVVHAAVAESLPKIVEALKQTGFSFDGDATRPARIPMTDDCIRKLKNASKETGISVSRLLLACLALTCDGEES
jgi:hypothetical protein